MPVFVAVRKCFLLLYERVTGNSIRGCVAVRFFFAVPLRGVTASEDRSGGASIAGQTMPVWISSFIFQKRLWGEAKGNCPVHADKIGTRTSTLYESWMPHLYFGRLARDCGSANSRKRKTRTLAAAGLAPFFRACLRQAGPGFWGPVGPPGSRTRTLVVQQLPSLLGRSSRQRHLISPRESYPPVGLSRTVCPVPT
jgi:hypothetical protein